MHCVYAVLSIMTLGHAHDALRYALIEVPSTMGGAQKLWGPQEAPAIKYSLTKLVTKECYFICYLL